MVLLNLVSSIDFPWLVLQELKSLTNYMILLFIIIGQIGLQAEARLRHYHPTKLFVFGDSYVDAGNTRKDVQGSWKEPYGITFPGKPAGRFSDGRVFSDYIGMCLPLSLFDVLSTETLKKYMLFWVYKVITIYLLLFLIKGKWCVWNLMRWINSYV